ncbi:MAG TPA: pitrilysin family protein [Thermoanaerobaculia bacterium]|nr:pitrilysin family protein [Thermoanaerobaculia bacterium]
MLRRSLLVLMLILAAAAAPAQLRIEHYELPNGLDVVLNEDHSAPLVAVNVWYHVGSKNEVPGRTGFAHLFEHMLFSGSKNVGANEHFRHVQSVGGTLNGSTTLDRTNYYETLPSNYLALGLWLEADRMGFFLPTLSQERLDVQKNVVKEERRQRYENVPYGIWLETLLRNGFPQGHPYSWPTIGSMADLTAAQLEDVKDFFRRYYAPNNAVLTVTGDFDPAEARALIQKYFASIPAGPAIQRPSIAPRRGVGEARETLEGAVQLPRVYRLYRLPKFGDRGWFAGALLANILGRDKASRLERSLVYEQQIAQDVVAFMWDAELEGMLMLWATAKQGVSPEKLEAALDAEIEKVIRNGVTETELERAKVQTETDFAHELEEFSARADFLSMLTTYFGDPKIAHNWLDRYRQITAADVQNVARDSMKKEDRVTLYYLPQKKSAERPAAGGAR